MKIGLSTANFFPDHNTEDMIDLYGKAGVDSVEIFLNTFSELEEDFIRLLKERCTAYGITVNSVHVMSMVMEPCLFDLLERRRQDFLKIFQRTLACIRELGCDIYTFHGVPKGMADPRHYAHLARCYDELCSLAEGYGVRLAQENVAYLASGDPQFILEMKRRMDNRLYHTLDIKQCVRAGIDPYVYLDAVAPDLVNVHLNDHDAAHHCLLPGEGTFDFDVFFSKLRDIGYQGNGILELYRNNFNDEKELFRARRALQSQAKKNGI